MIYLRKIIIIITMLHSYTVATMTCFIDITTVISPLHPLSLKMTCSRGRGFGFWTTDDRNNAVGSQHGNKAVDFISRRLETLFHTPYMCAYEYIVFMLHSMLTLTSVNFVFVYIGVFIYFFYSIFA